MKKNKSSFKEETELWLIIQGIINHTSFIVRAMGPGKEGLR